MSTLFQFHGVIRILPFEDPLFALLDITLSEMRLVLIKEVIVFTVGWLLLLANSMPIMFQIFD